MRCKDSSEQLPQPQNFEGLHRAAAYYTWKGSNRTRAAIEKDMKPQNESNSDPILERALREWELDCPLPPRFREQVWRQIERVEDRAPAAHWIQFVAWIGQALARPSLAVSYVTLLLLTGLLAGYLQARSDLTRTQETLSSRYVQMIDPYQTGP